MEKISRVGTYGIVLDQDKIFLVVQNKGPFKALYDLPGGGLDFGEEIEEALHREFIEETAHDFYHMEHYLNLSVCTCVPSQPDKEGYLFFQIGLIYKIDKLFATGSNHELIAKWISLSSLTEKKMAPLAWKAIKNFIP